MTGADRTADEDLRGVFAHLSDGVVIVDEDGRVAYVNGAFQRVFGYSSEEAVGATAHRFLPDPERPLEPAGLLEPRAGGLAVGECQGLSKTGEPVHVELTISQLRREGRILRIGLLRDVRDRKLSEAIDSVIGEMIERVLKGFDQDRILPFVCRRLVDLFRLPLVWIGTKEADGSIAVRAAAGREGVDMSRIRDLRWDRGPRSMGPTGRATRLGATQMATVDDPAWSDILSSARDAGFAAIASIPLRSQQQVVGVLNLYTCDGFGQGILRRLEVLAQRLGVAVQMVHDQRRLRLQGAAMKAAANAIFITDRNGIIEWVNDAFTRLSGYTEREVLGQTPRILNSGLQPTAFYEEFWRLITAGQVWRGEIVERRKDGSLYTVVQTVTPMVDADKGVTHFVVVHEDITERKQAEERIRFLSHYDNLTGLPNRTLFRERLRQAVGRCEANFESLALLFLDLDHFNRVNDTLGHDVGDRLLVQLVERLNSAARSADTVARIGGAEFAVVQTDLAGSEAAAALARRLIAAISEPFRIEEHEIHLGASVGISIYPNDAIDPDHLIKNADMAMYRAVREVPNGFRFFSNEMNEETRARLAMERDLRRALGRSEFMLHYQPFVEAESGRIVGLEALVRWEHPEQGMIGPGRFIPLAEETGLIVPLGEWVLREACRQVRHWLDKGLPVVPVSVNLSAQQLRQPDVVGLVRGIMDEYEVDGSLIELELTESSVMQDAGSAEKILTALAESGISLAIDDFGTGYSSLSYLKRFPVHKLKVDQSFVRDLTIDPNDAEIARAIIALGHSLGLRVVSEGVETVDQLRYLRSQGCDLIQGFLFSRPIPASEVMDLIQRQPFVEGGR